VRVCAIGSSFVHDELSFLGSRTTDNCQPETPRRVRKSGQDLVDGNLSRSRKRDGSIRVVGGRFRSILLPCGGVQPWKNNLIAAGIVLGLIVRSSPKSSKRRTAVKKDSDPRVQRALSCICEQHAGTLSVNAIARSVNLSSSRLRHLVKTETGLSLNRYVKFQTLDKSEGPSCVDLSIGQGDHGASRLQRFEPLRSRLQVENWLFSETVPNVAAQEAAHRFCAQSLATLFMTH